MPHRFGPRAEFEQGFAKTDQVGSHIGPGLGGYSEVSSRAHQIAHLRQRAAEIEAGIGVVGRKVERPAEGRDRLFEPPVSAIGFGKVGEIRCLASRRADGSFEEFDRIVPLAALVKKDSQQVKRIGLLRLGVEHTAMGMSQKL